MIGCSMRYFILACILPLSVFGQVNKEIKIVNGITHKPIKGLTCYILKDTDKWVDIGETNKKGVYTASLWNADSISAYQFYFSEEGFKPFTEKINLFDKKRITIAIYPDSSIHIKDPDLIYSECAYRSFGDYFPKEPHSINELPDSIRIRLVTHLIDRLGFNFYSKLKLTGGQIVDLKRLYIVEENAKNYQWTPYSYYLCFSFQDLPKGIGLYTSRIVLDKFGNVMDEIQMPSTNYNPSKANLISLKDAKTIALKNNFNSAISQINLDYDDKNDSFCWTFCKITNDNGLSFNTETLSIEAHSGNVLGICKGSGIR
jgi:hypothetical protein